MNKCKIQFMHVFKQKLHFVIMKLKYLKALESASVQTEALVSDSVHSSSTN